MINEYLKEHIAHPNVWAGEDPKELTHVGRESPQQGKKSPHMWESLNSRVRREVANQEQTLILNPCERLLLMSMASI